jgi:hypothetical protein
MFGEKTASLIETWLANGNAHDQPYLLATFG